MTVYEKTIALYQKAYNECDGKLYPFTIFKTCHPDQPLLSLNQDYEVKY